ncbi:septum formation inhibitor Maf [Steroidobacter denitrificans]|uniref:7-methyl-GTP pyrophosphatase n=1 Tax=Steroidobacter denitrificans TaxID=465721 RepID=A0A127FCF4_STEDE|nr:septum formation inhibitor Maf [Steroidobacter denitrificans]
MILASTSPYRRQLLERLGLPFATRRPDVDESARPGEDAATLTGRLAQAKAEAVAQRQPDSIVVGSDQLATCAGRILGKPGSEGRAIEQLRSLSGTRVIFHTAVHVMHSGSPREQPAQGQWRAGPAETHMDTTIVHFRSLSDEEIRRYVAREHPLDCAGGFKAEGLGISLFERIESQDPTGLIGLPLIWLAGALRRQGFILP